MQVLYRIDNMRVIFPKGKTAENHPERFATVYGVFHSEKGAKLSFTSKVINSEDVKSDDFSIDIDKGILTLTAKERGRKKSESVSQSEIEARLKALRK